MDNGEALLLIDGVDEVPEANRKRLREDLDAYAIVYPSTFLLVTSRPTAVRQGRWAQSFHHRLSVQPMSTDDIVAFIAKWHDALVMRSRNPVDVDIASLTRQVLDTPALRQLAEIPLLCAAICYLHRIKRGEIPRRAAQLNEEIIKQLVHQLDIDRLEKDGYEKLVPALKGLDLDEKTAILARLALAMVRAGDFELEPRECLARCPRWIGRSPQENDPNAVLAALQERSGVLRGASEEVVEFSHNALKTHLAASRLVSENAGSREVIRLAEATADPDLVLLTATQANIPYREAIIKMLLSDPAADEPTLRARQILAVRAAVDEVIDGSLCVQLDGVMPRLFPPRDMDEAAGLAELGEAAVLHLVHLPNEEAERNAASVRCLKQIATQSARERIEDYLNTRSMEVAAELAEVVHPLRVAAVANAVLGIDWLLGTRIPPAVTSGIRNIAPLLTRNDISQLDLDNTALSDTSLADIANLNGLRYLSLIHTQVGDNGLVHLAKLSGLHHLSLDHTQVGDNGIAHLAKLNGLRYLSLGGTQLGDNGLAHLARLTGLQQLWLNGTQVSDKGLAHLANLNSLLALWLNGTQVSDKGLVHLASLNGLLELSLSTTQVGDEGLAHLANSKSLQTLLLSGTQVSDDGLAYLANLNSLRQLFLPDTAIDRSSARVAQLRERGVDVHLE